MSLTRAEAAALGVPDAVLRHAYPSQPSSRPSQPTRPAQAVLLPPSQSWSFVVEGDPVPKGRPRVGIGGGRTPERTRVYEAKVADAARGLCDLGSGPVRVTVLVWLSSWRRLDLDNVLKAILDALVNAGAMADDSARVVRSCGIECMGVDKARPRVEVELQTMKG